MHTVEDIVKISKKFIESTHLNKAEDLKGMEIYDAPLIGIASAKDSLFLKLKEEGVIGEQHMTPLEWMSNAKTVISYFLPFTEAIRKANRENKDLPAKEWLYGRVEGQIVNDELSKFLAEKIKESGEDAVIPAIDPRFKDKNYRSNWSERHVAFIAGLGTFGLSKSLITEKGCAGRFGSVIVSVDLAPTERKYESTYEYCSECGACINRCPVHAIDKLGKKHEPCREFLDNVTKVRFAPRYGCGKCQTAVPCESRIPVKK